ncbi:hypothetical protein D3C75_160340 [compost metagenome]
MQFNDVHGAHCQACTVNHAADVAIQRHVVQFPLCSLRFTRIFLRLIAHFAQIGLAEQCVAVSAQFTVEADQVALSGDHQRVNFDQRQIALKEDVCQAHKDLGELLNQFTFQTQFERQLATLVRHRACQRIDSHFVDQVRGFFRHFFDFHAAFCRRHEHHATGATVYNRAEVQFFCDISRRFHQDLVNRLAVRVCLVGHQAFAQPVFSKGANLFFALNNFHTARFTTATSVNLTLNYPRAGTNFRCGFFSFTWGSTGITHRSR